jgi:hypothetical protein
MSSRQAQAEEKERNREQQGGSEGGMEEGREEGKKEFTQYKKEGKMLRKDYFYLML